jgi:hypothetical protein
MELAASRSPVMQGEVSWAHANAKKTADPEGAAVFAELP